MTVWLHTHLPRLLAGDTPDVISVKVPGQRIAYASWVSVRDVTFTVHEKGRQRCIAEGRRNVHAWVVGEEVSRLTGTSWTARPAGWRTALYDPFRGGSFVDGETLNPVAEARYAIVWGKNVWYKE